MSFLAKNRPKAQKTVLFTTSGTFVVPPDVHSIVVDGCGGGGGGGPGYAGIGGGGGGGGPGTALLREPMHVLPGETLTITIGAGGAPGGNGGLTLVLGGTIRVLACYFGAAGGPGTSTHGGAGSNVTGQASAASGTGVGAGGILQSAVMNHQFIACNPLTYRGASAGGGGSTFGGGTSLGFRGDGQTVAGTGGGASYGGTATATRSGGDGGGCSIFGNPGNGGNGGLVGANATGFGAGGGGGGSNAAGGSGSPGFVRIYYTTAY